MLSFAALSTLLATTAFALPQQPTPSPNTTTTQKFGLITIRSGSPVQNSGIQAAKSSLFVNLASQNSSCDVPDTNFATFYISDNKELHLYSTENPPQTIFVDRSGMGMGKIGYTTGAQGLGRNWEREGWAVGGDSGEELQFDGTGLQVCPGSIGGAWSVWLQGVDQPGWNVNCTGVIARTIVTEEPVGCLYTQ